MWVVIVMDQETDSEPQALPHVYNNIGRVKKAIRDHEKEALEQNGHGDMEPEPVELEAIEADAGKYYQGYSDFGWTYYVYQVEPE